MGLDQAQAGMFGGRPGPAMAFDARFPRVLAAALAAGIDIFSLTGGGLLAVRRAAGGWQEPAGVGGLIAICLAGGLLVVTADVARRVVGGRPGVAPRLGLALGAAALAIPLRTHGWLDVIAAIAALAAATTVAARPWLGSRAAARPAPLRDRQPLRPRPAPTPVITPVAVPSADPAAGHVLQAFTRFIRDDGVECVRGRLSLAVSAGVRIAAGHVGFCPPFPRSPSVEVATDYDGVEAVVTATEVLPWGVRVECRLDEPAEEDFDIPVDISAVAHPPIEHA